MTTMTTRQAKEKVKQLLHDHPKLRGVGITWHNGHQCVQVNVATGTAREIRERIRAQLPEIEFVIQEVGDITSD